MFWFVWLGIAVALLVVELLTSDLVSIWFAVAALIMSIIATVCKTLHWGWQLGIFAVLSIILLFATRPLMKKLLQKQDTEGTNLERILGHQGIVVEDIDNDFSKGAIKINGLVWTARSETGEKIPQGEFVVVKHINGNKVFVIQHQKEEK